MSSDINQLFKEMADHSNELYFIYNTNERQLEYINAAFEILTKRKSKELFNKPEKLFKIIHKQDLPYVKNALYYLMKNKTISLLNFRICQPDGNERWVRLKISPVVNDGNVDYLTGMGEDDTARKTNIFNMQQVLGWKDANLEILSHDLRGPLGTVQLLTTLIDSKLPDNPEIHELTKMIADISKRNITLIQTLLKKEFLSTADVVISKERLDVVWEIKQVTDIYLKSQDNIKKQMHFTHSDISIFAEVDSMKFLQILNNLISNSIKFTPDQGKIHIHVEKLDRSFLVKVLDDGIGIPKHLQPFLFDKHSEAGREGLKGEESLGLGMWIVKTLTEAHGGKVWFKSQEHKGTTFCVEIPLGFEF
jgi:two-component system sensor histidine kinase VicK